MAKKEKSVEKQAAEFFAREKKYYEERMQIAAETDAANAEVSIAGDAENSSDGDDENTEENTEGEQ
jgi:hypothetical protein